MRGPFAARRFVHAELAHRAGISIDWAATDKADYLNALTRELGRPGKGHLDRYLKPFVGPALGRDRLAGHVARTPGLDGKAREPPGANAVAGRFSDPGFQAHYRQQELRRAGKDDAAAHEPSGGSRER